MEQVIWVEVLSERKQVTARHRCLGATIKIGRGYDNDVVLDDPFIAPRHITIERESDGSLVAVDTGSSNGLFVGESQQREKRIKLEGDTTLRLGRTLLRVRNSTFPVPSERKLLAQSNLWISLFLPAVAYISLSFLSEWLSYTRPFKPFVLLTFLLMFTIVPLGWASIWAVMSRIFSEKTRFVRHLKTAIFMFLALDLYKSFQTFVAFSFSTTMLNKFEVITFSLILVIFCFRHLRIIGRTRLFWKAGVVSVLFLSITSLYILKMTGTPDIENSYDFVNELEPPALRLAKPQPEKDFWDNARKLESRLVEARKDVPPKDAQQSLER